jgi:hypothetical protein
MVVQIAGYRFGDPALPPSPVSGEDLERLKAAVLFGPEDVAALRRAGAILGPRREAILDVWYGFVGSQPYLLESFATPAGPDADYLARVRARFGQWIVDTCAADYDATWLAYEQEIGRRHAAGKNETDGVVGAPPLVHFRYVNALVYPIYATIRPFLEEGESDPAAVERMHQAWLKSLILQVTLWSRAYLGAEAW